MEQLLKFKAQVSSIWTKGWMFDDCVCVCYLTCHDYPSLVEGESHGILLLMEILIFRRSSKLIWCEYNKSLHQIRNSNFVVG